MSEVALDSKNVAESDVKDAVNLTTNEGSLPNDAHKIVVNNAPFEKMPDDLYIPPDALEVILESFEGPLDLLLYLIRKQNLDILDIPMARITKQYVEYVNLMQELKLDLAAEYLVMAATLAQIKSRLLLPRPAAEELEDGEDPRAALIRRLQEYERFRAAAQQIDDIPRQDRDLFIVSAQYIDNDHQAPIPNIELDALLKAFEGVMLRAKQNKNWVIEREVLSVRERMTMLLDLMQQHKRLRLEQVFDVKEGRMGLVVSLVAVLELVKDHILVVIQNEPYTQVYIESFGKLIE